MPSRTPCAEGDGCVETVWRGPEELPVLQGRRGCRAGLGLVALGRVAGEQDASRVIPGHRGWSRAPDSEETRAAV